MAVIDTIDGYNLRRDTLLNYLRKLFPGDSSSITAEVRILFRAWVGTQIHGSTLAFYLIKTG